MEQIQISAHTETFSKKLEQLCSEGKLFGEDFRVLETKEVEQVSEKLIEDLGRDLAKHLGESNGNTRGKVLFAGPIHGTHHAPPVVSLQIVAYLGNGYCAYGHYAGGACWYDGIGKC